MGQLKNIFINLASKSSWPCVTLLDFAKYIEETKMMDKNINIACIDRTFIATNFRDKDQDKDAGNPDKALTRFEFLEILCRLGKEKYMPHTETTIAGCLTRLLDECVFANDHREQWQEFRDEQLWTLEVDDLLRTNEDNLKFVYSKFFTQVKKYMEFDDVLKVFTKYAEKLNVSENLIKWCFGMSKMTVINEMTQQTKYTKMEFVEFLEFIGRLAHMKYKNDIDLNLVQKMEIVLDEVFAGFGLERKEVIEVIEEHSESDPDY